MPEARERARAVAGRLDAIEARLGELGLWADGGQSPSAEALGSTLPFCCDTLEFHEWLQFVLVRRLREALAQGGRLPQNMLVHPYAEEVYRGQWHKYRNLIQSIRELDDLFAQDGPNYA
ncbi:MAG: YqcC family protein [Succinivibrionaceae bacterium]|nr:YqcC family protein [Succinivibrionaceae bacterium]